MEQTRIAGGKWILLVLAVTMLATPAVAQATGQQATMGTAAANVDADQAGTGGDVLAGETVNLHVSDADGSGATYSFDVTADERIENLERGARDDATLTMRTDAETFERVAHASNPERKFQTAVERGAVETRSVDDSGGAEWDVFSGVEALARSLGLS